VCGSAGHCLDTRQFVALYSTPLIPTICRMISRYAVAALAFAAVPEAASFVAAPLPMGRAARMGAVRSAATRPAVHSLRSTAAAAAGTGNVPGYGDLTNVQLSPMNGKALKDKEFPSVKEVKNAMPEGTWVRDDKVGSVHIIARYCITCPHLAFPLLSFHQTGCRFVPVHIQAAMRCGAGAAWGDMRA
jgi:hypothetical protein